MLRVGGITQLSASDWPGQLAVVVFCQGCPWRCGYCHNPDLIPARSNREIHWDEVLGFLDRRQGLLDAVVFSGGEPTLQSDLPEAMHSVRALGYKIGLHTGGMYPKKLSAVLTLVDWVGMDVKAPFSQYARITGAKGSGEPVQESLSLLLASGVDHEIRTTVHPALLADEEVFETARELAASGVKRYVVQAFHNRGCRDESLRLQATCTQSLQVLIQRLTGLFDSLSLRT